eukprot:33296-Eustigmatos_ZCMA.PRE.1
MSSTVADGSGTGKWGTYLRFRRVSNYGDTTTIHRKIVHYLRNYVLTDAQLVRILENEFSIVTEEATRHLQTVRESGG